ncbi:MAG: flippase-like domain-containing protein [Chloroflexi bacterium]|nr:flippase-like domain-containing protein [Chloroflexota bacterium]
MRRNLFIFASIVASVFFLWLALRDIDMAQVISVIAQTHLAWYALGLFTVFLGLWTRAVRWRGLLGFKIPLSHAFHILNIGMMLNLIPLRAGEFARSVLVIRDGVPFVTGATSIVIERVLDTLLVVVTLALLLTRVPAAPEWVTRSALLFGVASVVAFVVLIAFARFPVFGHRVIDELEKRLPLVKRLALGQLLGHMIDGLEPLTHPRRFAHAVGWTLISWVVSLITYYCIEVALGINQGDLWLGAALSMTLASLSIAVPVSVAGIGPFQLAVRAASDMAGIPATLSVPLSLLAHANAVLVYAVLGTIGLLAMGVSLSSLLGEQAKVKTDQTL